MKYFYPKLHSLHKPKIDYSDGLPGYEHKESDDRVDLILEGLLKAKEVEVIYVEELATKEVKEIHDDNYVDFLLEISNIIEKDEEYIPSIFRKSMTMAPLHFRGGMYCEEIGTPIGKESVKSALNSAQTAIEASKYMLKNSEDVFVLTRPPGHHAGKKRYGGYCFFNNAYLAANTFNKNGKKVAVIDIDYHIGDGSLEFASNVAPYFSIHAGTNKSYPYNEFKSSPYVNLQEFEAGVSIKEYMVFLEKILEDIRQKDIDIIIVSLGFDILETDPLQDAHTCIKLADFTKIAEAFSTVKQKIMFLLEGGYDTENLSQATQNFMNGFSCQR